MFPRSVCGALLLMLSFVVSQAEAMDKGLLLSPKAFRAAAEKTLPSVVTIEAFGDTQGFDQQQTARANRANRGNRRGRRRRGGGLSKPGEGPTTGTIISPDGYIITSTYNFIRKQPIITVVLRDGTQHVAKLLGRDDTRKLCLLKVDGVKDLPVPEMVSPDKLKVGQWAITLGMGYGGEDSAISAGIVSATRRISGKAVQTDANISPANYGGPLIDIEGRMIGICVPLSPRSRGTAGGVEWYDSGIGFAIPLTDAERWLKEMKAGKTLKPARLGVRPENDTPKGGGVKIREVQKDSPAAKAELKKGDIIIAVNDEKVIDVLALRIVLGRFLAGDEVTVVVKRGDEELKVKVKLTDGQDHLAPQAQPRIIERRIEPKKVEPKKAEPKKKQEGQN